MAFAYEIPMLCPRFLECGNLLPLDCHAERSETSPYCIEEKWEGSFAEFTLSEILGFFASQYINGHVAYVLRIMGSRLSAMNAQNDSDGLRVTEPERFSTNCRKISFLIQCFSSYLTGECRSCLAGWHPILLFSNGPFSESSPLQNSVRVLNHSRVPA